jgi:hypothetical protein
VEVEAEVKLFVGALEGVFDGVADIVLMGDAVPVKLFVVVGDWVAVGDAVGVALLVGL